MGRGGSGPVSSGGGSRRVPQDAREPARAAVSKLNGHSPFTLGYPAMHAGMQQMTNEVIAQLDQKISATVR